MARDCFLLILYTFHNFTRISHSNYIIGNVFGDNTSRSYYGVISNRYTR